MNSTGFSCGIYAFSDLEQDFAVAVPRGGAIAVPAMIGQARIMKRMNSQAIFSKKNYSGIGWGD